MKQKIITIRSLLSGVSDIHAEAAFAARQFFVDNEGQQTVDVACREKQGVSIRVFRGEGKKVSVVLYGGESREFNF